MIRKIKTHEEILFHYGPEDPQTSDFVRVLDKWLLANSHYRHLFEKTNPHHAENSRAFTFTAEKYAVPSEAAFDFSIEEAIANKRLFHGDGTPAVRFVVPEPPLEPVDFQFLEIIGQMTPNEVAQEFAKDPDSRFCRRYKMTAASHGYRLPHGVDQPAVHQEESDPYEKLTSKEYHSIPARDCQRLYLTNKFFKKAVDRLIAQNTF